MMSTLAEEVCTCSVVESYCLGVNSCVCDDDDKDDRAYYWPLHYFVDFEELLFPLNVS